MSHKTAPHSNSTTPFFETRQNLQKNKVCCGHKVLGRLMRKNWDILQVYISQV